MLGVHASHVHTELLQDTTTVASSELASASAELKDAVTRSSHPVATPARGKNAGKNAGKQTEETAENADENGAKAKQTKASRKAQIQALVADDPDDKEHEAPGLFIQGTFTGPQLSLVAYILYSNIIFRPPSPNSPTDTTTYMMLDPKDT